MVGHHPQVAGHADRHFRQCRGIVLIREPCDRIFRSEQSREFFVVEPKQTDIEVFFLKGDQLDPKQLVIPACR